MTAGAHRVSVLMPVFNARPFVGAAIESILRQTLTDLRLFVLDDGSDDGTAEVLSEWARRDPRVDVICRPNRGIVAALNELVEKVDAPFVARMDADDVAEPCRLELQVAELERNPAAVAIGGWVRVFGEAPSQTWHFRASAAATRVVSLLGNTCLCHPTITMRADVLRHYGYRAEYESMEDMDLLCRILRDDRAAEMYALPQILHHYRLHPASVSSRRRERQMALRERILEEYHRSLGIAWSAADRDAMRAFLGDGTASEVRVDRVRRISGRLQSVVPLLAGALAAETERRLDQWRLRCPGEICA